MGCHGKSFLLAFARPGLFAAVWAALHRHSGLTLRATYHPSPMNLPPRLAWLEQAPGGPEWLAVAPRPVAEAAEAWGLTLGEPFEDVYESVVFPATTREHEAVVLKVQFPNRENEREAAALARWNGDGAVRLLAHDVERHALLLERAAPGTPLSELAMDEALGVFVDLLARLWVPAGPPFRLLADEAAWWAETLVGDWERDGRPFERRLIDAALEALAALIVDPAHASALLHQDLHADNVLRSTRQPWP
jgi:streptomycin 6-kinase